MTEMENFSVGEVVRLKSGGRTMTVRDGNTDDDGMVKCEWMTDRGSHWVRDFYPETLERVR